MTNIEGWTFDLGDVVGVVVGLACSVGSEYDDEELTFALT